MALKRLGILTCGGDYSGLNAVIRAATRSAIIEHEAEVVGIKDGFDGFIFDHHRMLSIAETKEILTLEEYHFVNDQRGTSLQIPRV
jgi:ATP-dependent phosphofructokinase / diphosphate-dependent phosphofructokinase